MIVKYETHSGLLVLEQSDAEFQLTGSRMRIPAAWRTPNAERDIDFFAVYTPELEFYLIDNGFEPVSELKDKGDLSMALFSNWESYKFKWESQGVVSILRYRHAYPIALHIDVQLLTAASFQYKRFLHAKFGYIPKDVFPYLYNGEVWNYIKQECRDPLFV